MQTIPTSRHHSNAAVQRLRDQRRADGMRAIQIWVPDTRKLEFIVECRRQAHNVASHPSQEHEVMDWIESVVDGDGWLA